MDERLQVMLGGVLYDIVSDIASNLTSKLNIDHDLAVAIAGYYLAGKYPRYKNYLMGISAVAASKVINIGDIGLFKPAQAQTQPAPTAPTFVRPRVPSAPGRGWVRIPLMR